MYTYKTSRYNISKILGSNIGYYVSLVEALYPPNTYMLYYSKPDKSYS